MQILAIILVIAVAIFYLYILIQSAVDHSDTAQNIKDIKKMLAERFSNENNDSVNSKKENYNILDIPFDECPACHAKVSPTDKKCPSCGLYLNNTDDKK